MLVRVAMAVGVLVIVYCHDTTLPFKLREDTCLLPDYNRKGARRILGK